ncbi:MAG: DciA family protein [Methylococcales bacterium]
MVMKKNIPSVTQVMKAKHPTLSDLQQRLKNHADLLKLTKQSLPLPLAENCIGCCYKQSTLILYSRSAIWISQLRFYKTELLETIQAKAPQFAISDVIFRVLVTPDGLTVEQPVNQPIRPSHQTIKEIASGASYVSDKQLRLSLEKLAQTLNNQKE